MGREHEPIEQAAETLIEVTKKESSIRKDLFRILNFLARKEKESVNRILISYWNRLISQVHPNAAFDEKYGLLLYEEKTGQDNTMWIFFSPKEGIYKLKYAGFHQGSLDFGPWGPMFFQPPEKMGDGEFAKASIICLARIVEETERGKRYWEANRSHQEYFLPSFYTTRLSG